MAAGQSGQTGRPVVRSAGEELRLVTGPAVIRSLLMEGRTVPESILMFSRATIFHVSDQTYSYPDKQSHDYKIFFFMFKLVND